MEQFSRTELLFNKEAMKKLKESKVAIFGLGGVGGYVVEALARSGVGKFVLIDNDVIDITNINRQIIATLDTLGQSKCEVMKKRILSINKEAEVETFQCFYNDDNASLFKFNTYSYIVDCIDSISSKLSLVEKAKQNQVPIISAMGAGNKLDPTLLQVEDIFSTSYDPIAKVMRHELKKRNIKHLKVVYSKEKPINIYKSNNLNNKRIPGSNAFVPPSMGLIIASEVTKDLINFHDERE